MMNPHIVFKDDLNLDAFKDAANKAADDAATKAGEVKDAVAQKNR